jgi:hypothetical protein
MSEFAQPVCPKHGDSRPYGTKHRQCTVGACTWTSETKWEKWRFLLVVGVIVVAWALRDIAQAGDYMGDDSAPWVAIYWLMWGVIGVAVCFIPTGRSQ